MLKARSRQSLQAQRTDPKLYLYILAELFPEKSPAAPQNTEASDEFAIDSEEDEAKLNGENGVVKGEDGGRTDVNRAAGKRGKVGVTLPCAADGEHEQAFCPVGVCLSYSCLRTSRRCKAIWENTFPECQPLACVQRCELLAGNVYPACSE